MGLWFGGWGFRRGAFIQRLEILVDLSKKGHDLVDFPIPEDERAEEKKDSDGDREENRYGRQ
jgi:hypothetical protein